MKNQKSILLSSLFAITLFASLTSCMATYTPVGAFKETPGNEYTFAKGKQLWLFWGLMPLGRTNVSTPTNGVCEVSTRYNIGDFLISGFTGGIVTSQSIKVKAKK